MADPELPHAISVGIATLEALLGGDDLLSRVVPPRPGELASFDFALPQDFLGRSRTAQIGFLRSFPLCGLRLLITPSAFLEWPHVMADSVCLFEDQKRPIGGGSQEVVTATVRQLSALVELVLPGADSKRREEEFTREIRSYWCQQLRGSECQLILADIPAEAQPLFVLTDSQLRRGVESVVLASTTDELAGAFARLGATAGRIKAPATAAFYLPLTNVPPLRMPSPDKLVEWLEGAVSNQGLEKVRAWLAAGDYPFRFLLLRLPQVGGVPAFHAMVIRSRGLTDAARPRYGRRADRHLSSKPSHSKPARIDGGVLHVLAREVVHSRAPEVHEKLKDAHVVLVGTGALGSPLALHLARAGVGRLTLIDPDVLEAGNLGRHVLGTRHLGEFKVSALKERLHLDVPSVAVTAINEYVQINSKDVEKALGTATLVVVSTADWWSELWLWERKASDLPWPLVQVWSEPHGFVGHALVSPRQSSDSPRSLFDNAGEFLHRFSEWPGGGVVHQPACGGSFVPGGPVALAAIAAMGAQAAIDVLTDATTSQRWYSLVNRATSIRAAGGTYLGPELVEGAESQVFVRPWPESSGGSS